NEKEHHSRDHDREERNSEMDVGFARIILEQRPHQREGSDSNSHDVGDNDSDEATEQHDEQRFREELGFDVPFARAQGKAQADFADALIDRDEHDVHHADTANAQRQNADKDQQHLKADRDAIDDRAELFAAKHLDRF